ncbi:hypothetical protein [Brevundimonas sp.]|uniref:hypothetical protein n=1 Tax=Brevundimonas sp. TaxID=1871086 RepID=UPI002FDB73B6
MRNDAPAATSRAMDLTLTLILLAASLALTVFAGWRGAQPPNLIKGPRMVPWRFLMVMGAALVMLLLIHLATLGGMTRADWV